MKYYFYTLFLTTFFLFSYNSQNDQKTSAYVCNQFTKETTEFYDSSKILTKVHYINVGHGDCILISVGNHWILIDSGKNSDGEVIVDYLKHLNVKIIDLFILTHQHGDHIGGAPAVFENFLVKRVIDTGDSTGSILKKHKDILTNNGGIWTSDFKQKYSFDGVNLEVLTDFNTSDNPNSNSIVIKLVHNEISFLFTGDIEIDKENELDGDLRAQIMKVSHHGLKTSTSRNFINKVGPEVAIISCGKGLENFYSDVRPSKEVLKLLVENNVKVLRTDELGSIMISTDGTNYMINNFHRF